MRFGEVQQNGVLGAHGEGTWVKPESVEISKPQTQTQTLKPQTLICLGWVIATCNKMEYWAGRHVGKA